MEDRKITLSLVDDVRNYWKKRSNYIKKKRRQKPTLCNSPVKGIEPSTAGFFNHPATLPLSYTGTFMAVRDS